MEDLIEESVERLMEMEDEVAAAIAAILDRYFRTLQGRIQTELRIGQFQSEETAVQDYQLLPLLPPDESDELLQIFEDLLQQSTTNGLALGEELSKPVVSSQVAATIPKEAVASEARRARRYLEQHSLTFSTAAAGIIAQARAEQTDLKEVNKQLKRQLDIVKSRMGVIVRTEAAKASNNAATSLYVQNNVKLVVIYATSGERTCPYCIASSGRVYKLGAIKVPRHIQCHCVIVPYATDPFGVNSEVDKFRRKHRKEVLSYARAKGIQPNEGPAFFELGSPLPIRTDAQR